MITSQEIIYKGIKEIKAGQFINSKGETVKYRNSYKIRFEMINNGLPDIFSCRIDQEKALQVAQTFKIGDKAKIYFDINIYRDGSSNLYFNRIEKI